ncbi:MAG: hypothetical protein L6V84_09150 [Oscillospiraceae bacterium]|nr:MAG: hypothetical protein L6V84_09150 [Oscillospiraceae bacterium]
MYPCPNVFLAICHHDADHHKSNGKQDGNHTDHGYMNGSSPIYPLSSYFN